MKDDLNKNLSKLGKVAVAGQVDRVLFRNGTIGLVVDGITIGLGALIEINGSGSNEG